MLYLSSQLGREELVFEGKGKREGSLMKSSQYLKCFKSFITLMQGKIFYNGKTPKIIT